jgi:hypothetical protein
MRLGGEACFLWLVAHSTGIKVPFWFNAVTRSRHGQESGAWLQRRRLSPDGVQKASFLIFKVAALCASLAVVVTILLAGLSALGYATIPALLLPLVLASWVANTPASSALREERSMLREAPTVVGYLTMSMQLQPSLERAVAFAGDREPGVLQTRLRSISWALLTRGLESVEAGMHDLSASLSEVNENLRQALHLIMSATSESSKAGMDRLLDKANSLVIEGVKDAVERYVASLTMPTLFLFSFGILLPVMLFSMVPLLTLTVSLSDTSVSEGLLGPGLPLLPIAVLLLAILPAVSLFYSTMVVGRAPMARGYAHEIKCGWRAAVLIAAWLLASIVASLTLTDQSSYFVILVTTIPPPLFLFVVLRRHRRKGPNRAERRSMISALYQIGNRMTTGASFEAALSASSRPGTAFSAFAESALYRWRASRDGIEHSMAHDATLASNPLVHGALMTVAECARKDSVAAGKVALNLAQYLSDLDSCEERIEGRLKSVVDMMRTTSLVFAPIVLGITTSLFGIIGTVQPTESLASSVQLMTGIYVAELSFIVCYFTTFLLGEHSWSEVGYQFGVRAPISVLLFIAVSASFQSGLTQLL